MSLKVAIFEQSARRTLAGSLASQRKIVYRVLKLVPCCRHIRLFRTFGQSGSVVPCSVRSRLVVRGVLQGGSVQCMSEANVEEIASAEDLRKLVEDRLQSSEAACSTLYEYI